MEHPCGWAVRAGANANQLRTEDNYVTRARGYITTDVREQTSYGTLRAYLAAGWQYSSDDAPTISLPGAQSTASSLTTTFTSGVVCAVLNHGGVGEHTPGTLGTIHGSFAVSPTGCADWAAWQIGSRTLWNPVRNLDVGVDVLYTAMAKTAFSGPTAQLNIPTSNAGQANVSVGDTHIWSGILRIQYNFYP